MTTMISILPRICRAAGLVRSTRELLSLVRSRPRSIASLELVRAIEAAVGQVGTIIDAGANVGQFARAAVLTFPNADIISIEPLPDAALELRRNLGDSAQVQIIEVALGDSDGTATFYPNAYSQASSILRITESASKVADGLSEMPPIDVKLTRLDSLLQGRRLTPPVLFKLDLQGYELRALRGCEEVIKSMRYIVCEVAFESYYAGEPKFAEICEFLQPRGFYFDRPLNVARGVDHQIFQMDALFVSEKSPGGRPRR